MDVETPWFLLVSCAHDPALTDLSGLVSRTEDWGMFDAFHCRLPRGGNTASTIRLPAMWVIGLLQLEPRRISCIIAQLSS